MSNEIIVVVIISCLFTIVSVKCVPVIVIAILVLIIIIIIIFYIIIITIILLSLDQQRFPTLHFCMGGCCVPSKLGHGFPKTFAY